MKKNFLLTIFTLFFFVIFVEVFLRLLVEPRTIGINVGILNSKFVKQNYIFDKDNFRNNKSIIEADYVFLGDSFTFGSGLKTDQGFVEKFKKKVISIDSKKKIYNLGKNGTNTLDQYRILKNYKLKSNFTLIYQYYYNDIDYLDKKIISPQLKENLNQKFYTKFLVNFFLVITNNFYTFDYFFTPLILKYYFAFDYKNFEVELYERHSNDIKLIFDYVNKKNGRIIFLPLPILGSVENINFSSDNYINFLKKKFYKFCYSNDILASIDNILLIEDQKKLIVSPVDMHASDYANTIIANLLYSSLNEKNNKNIIKCNFNSKK
jgi:hypothetical protein